MVLKKTTVLVDEDDLATIKRAAAAEGRPESEYFREAFRIAALRARRWDGDWDMPEFALGRRVTDDDVHAAADDAANHKYRQR